MCSRSRYLNTVPFLPRDSVLVSPRCLLPSCSTRVLPGLLALARTLGGAQRKGSLSSLSVPIDLAIQNKSDEIMSRSTWMTPAIPCHCHHLGQGHQSFRRPNLCSQSAEHRHDKESEKTRG
eukprot:3763313-Rhodomonas_salina.1